MNKFKTGQYVSYTRNGAIVEAKIVYITMHGVLFLDNGHRMKSEDVEIV